MADSNAISSASMHVIKTLMVNYNTQYSEFQPDRFLMFILVFGINAKQGWTSVMIMWPSNLRCSKF